MAAPSASPLFLREAEIRRGVELLFFGYSNLYRGIACRGHEHSPLFPKTSSQNGFVIVVDSSMCMSMALRPVPSSFLGSSLFPSPQAIILLYSAHNHNLSARTL